MTSKLAQTRGISNRPVAIPYPKMLEWTNQRAIFGMLVYVIKHYGNDGISVVITRDSKKDEVYVSYNDWHGNRLDLKDGSGYSNLSRDFTKDSLSNLITVMRSINIEQAQFYFAVHESVMQLVDVRISANKLLSPGFVRDMFSKMYLTQEIIKIENIDDRSIEAINKAVGSYEGNLIIKPSVFKTVTDGSVINPYYLEVLR